MIIQVPATTANLGPGFDSFGLALSLYLEIEVLGESALWSIEHELHGISHDESNLIIQVAKQVYPEVKPQQLKMRTSIPTARGLGSSSSAIVAGIELANQLGNLQLSSEKKVEIATKIEGHPDNVAPAILGSFVVSTTIKSKTYYNQHQFPDCGLITIIPSYELLTSDSRDVLPKTISFKEGVIASSVANMALSFLITNQLEKATELMAMDMWHQPYRKKLIKEFEVVQELKEKLGFYCALISGAGPTILVLTSLEKLQFICDELKEKFSDCEVRIVKQDSAGVKVKKRDCNRSV